MHEKYLHKIDIEKLVNKEKKTVFFCPKLQFVI